MSIINRMRLFLTPVLILFLFSDNYSRSNVVAKFVSSVESIKSGDEFILAVKLEMADGWHTYWSNPGDAGLATKIIWELPDGFSVSDIRWPYPERIDADGVTSYGYHNSVLLLSEVKSAENLQEGRIVKIRAKVSWLECNENCLPGSQELEISLPVSPLEAENNLNGLEEIEHFLGKIPLRIREPFSASVRSDKLILPLVPELLKENKIVKAEFFPYRGDNIDHAAPQRILEKDKSRFLELRINPRLNKFPDDISGVLTLEIIENGKRVTKSYDVNFNIFKQ